MGVNTNVFGNDFKLKNWKNNYFWIQALFYFLQGVFLAGIIQYSGIRMAEWGVPLSKQATFTALTSLPAMLKLFMGLFTDRVVIGKWGRRKPYIVFGLLVTIPAYISYLSAGDYTGLFIAQLLAFIAWAIVDTTLDALTVDITPDEYDSQMQSFAQGGRYSGMAVGAFSVPVLGPIIGWETIIIIIGMFGILMPISALLIRETPVTKEDLKGNMALGKMFKKAFSSKTTWLGLAASIFMFGGITFTFVSNYVLTTFHWNEDPAKMKIYGVASLLALLGTMVGAIIMGRIYRSRGFKMRTIVIATVIFLLLTSVWWIFEANPENIWLYALCSFVRNIGNGMMVVTIYTIIMRICIPSIEGFIFALMTSVMNIGQLAISPKILGATLPKFGITLSMLVLSLAVIFAVFLISLIMKELDKEQPAV